MTDLLPEGWTDWVGKAALGDAGKRARGCSRPVRLVGSTTRVNRETGEVIL